ncbi:MAG: DNA repair protein RadC [Alphaproteobacteria bacterium]|nr:DNA repair protein RadC [Alphaproteobacteria bacterium]OJV12181.1 MAG: hypothetical protein BGO27_05525 [Alphaproteobacteria bacterium 33-17]
MTQNNEITELEEADIEAYSPSPFYIGHRQRAKERFLKSKPGSFSEYDLLELVLFYVVPRSDTKPIARELLYKFGSISKILNALPNELKNTKGLGNSAYTFFRLIKEVSAKQHEEEMRSKPILESWSALIKYARTTMGHLKTEVFRVIYLNKKNMIIADEFQDFGTVDNTPVYPREIIKKALNYEASSIILLHNHPSGNTNPSKSDIYSTNDIQRICLSLGIELIDHIIISGESHYSFKNNGLL